MTIQDFPKVGPVPAIFILPSVVICFVLSGFAALLYQTAWMRQFSLVFGTSELAVAAVLAAYMGGLSLGAAIAAKYVHRITRPVWFYGLLEGGIALSAIAVPILLKFASYLYTGAFGDQPEPVDASGLGQSFFYLAIAFIVLALPTCFMGATLPLLTKYVVHSKEQIGTRVGLLYASNTAGAIGGAIIAGFVLLPAFGLNGTVYIGVLINLVVFLVAVLVAKSTGVHTAEGLELTSSLEHKSRAFTGRWWILPIMLLSGVASFIYEVLWTRLLGHILGGSITAFATMLASFLCGIAIGSAIASRYAQTRQQATRWFIVAQCGIAITSILIYQLLPTTVAQSNSIGSNAMLAFAVMVPATLFIGATFPLAVRVFALDERDAGSSSARVYSWNTVGAIIGATAAAFFLIPALKYEGTVKFVVLMNIVLALVTLVLLGRQFKSLAIGVVILALGVTLFYQPAIPEAILRSSPIYSEPEGDIRFYEVGRSATVLVIEKGGWFNLRTNGLPEASTSVKGSPPNLHNQLMLGALPVLARPNTESMLIVGLGAGTAVEGVPKSVKAIDVVELEPEVVNANRLIGDQRILDPLQDPRVNVILNDARTAMSLTSKRYDAIVSQPSHPWTAGASHLYTREYMSLAHERLTDTGVYLQWMNSQFVDEYLLRSLCATMLDVFKYVRIYQWNSGVLFFLGSDSPLEIEQAIAQTGRPLNDDPLGYLEKGVGTVEDVVAALAMDHVNVKRFAAGGEVITDNDNMMATRSAQIIGTAAALTGSRIYELLRDYDPLLDAKSALRTEFPVEINYPYLSRRFELMGLRRRAIDLADDLINAGDSQALVMIAQGQERQGQINEAEKKYRLALKADPDNQHVRYALLQPRFEEILNAETVPERYADELRRFSGTGLSTLRGRYALSKSRLNELANLDAELAGVLPSDPWYELSVKLRADWRIQLTSPELQPRMALEAIDLIDSAIVFSQSQDLHAMRLDAAMVAKDMPAAIETARRLIYLVDQEIIAQNESGTSVENKIIRVRTARISRVQKLLNQLSSNPLAAQPKVEQLLISAADTQEQLALLDGY